MVHIFLSHVSSCWTKTPSVQQWLTQHNFTGDQAYAYFVKKTAAFAIQQVTHPAPPPSTTPLYLCCTLYAILYVNYLS